jgi:hypothetical protein
MADGKISSLPISEIHSEDGAQELVRSEKMKPYLAFLKAQMSGQDTEPYLGCIGRAAAGRAIRVASGLCFEVGFLRS